MSVIASINQIKLEELLHFCTHVQRCAALALFDFPDETCRSSCLLIWSRLLQGAYTCVGGGSKLYVPGVSRLGFPSAYVSETGRMTRIMNI